MMQYPFPIRRTKKLKGLTLVEMLVAIFIMSAGMLGFYPPLFKQLEKQ